MILTLEVIGSQAALLGDAARKVFNADGGSIGRSRENDWVIPSPYISGKHAQIHWRNGRYFIVDHSTNGTWLKTRNNRLIKGDWYALENQDRLYMQGLEIQVLLEGAEQEHPTLKNVAPPPRPKPLPVSTDAMLAVLLGQRDLASLEQELQQSADTGADTATVDKLYARTLTTADAELAQFVAPNSGSQSPPRLLDTEQVRTLATGSGIPPEAVTPELSDALSRILHASIQGLIELQQARDAMKDTFRLLAPTLKSPETNPLRLAANAEDALHSLLVKRSAAHLSPALAISSSFKDALRHQAAMLHAMRVAYAHVLTEFDPKQFAEEGGKRRNLFNHKQDAWQLFCERHDALSKQADSGFRQAFGEAFADAYQQELDRLTQQEAR